MNSSQGLIGLILAVKSLIILALINVVNGDCPNNAIDQMHSCTAKLANLTTGAGEDIKTVEQSCRNLMEVPICLESILYKCEGHSDFESVEYLKKITNLWKDKVQKICSNIISDSSSSSQKTTLKSVTYSVILVLLVINLLQF